MINTNKQTNQWTRRLIKDWRYLFLDAAELRDLDDERGGASLVLNGSKQSSYIVHTEGLWPAPVPPSLDADVQQLQDSTESEYTHKNRDRS